MALAVGVLFLISMLVNTIIQSLAGDSPGFLGQIVLEHHVYRFFPWLVTLAIFLLIYRFVPNRRTYWRYTWPGALVAALLFEVGKSLFLWYLGNFASFNQVYGNVASVIILLLWAYLSSFVLILGAEINSEYERIYGHEPEVQDRVSL